MQIFYRKGYIVYQEKGEHNFTSVPPHAGAALEIPTSRDDNSETVASLCWMKTGGNFILSTMPRKRAFGVDFNRGIPKKTVSLVICRKFQVLSQICTQLKNIHFTVLPEATFTQICSHNM